MDRKVRSKWGKDLGLYKRWRNTRNRTPVCVKPLPILPSEEKVTQLFTILARKSSPCMTWHRFACCHQSRPSLFLPPLSIAKSSPTGPGTLANPYIHLRYCLLPAQVSLSCQPKSYFCSPKSRWTMSLSPLPFSVTSRYQAHPHTPPTNPYTPHARPTNQNLDPCTLIGPRHKPVCVHKLEQRFMCISRTETATQPLYNTDIAPYERRTVGTWAKTIHGGQSVMEVDLVGNIGY